MNEDIDVIRKMEKYGGSFVKALANAARYADPENLTKIKTTWPDYWAKYSQIKEYNEKNRIGDSSLH